MKQQRLIELLTRAERKHLDDAELSQLDELFSECPASTRVRRVMRERCIRYSAPRELRVRILSTLVHRQVG